MHKMHSRKKAKRVSIKVSQRMQKRVSKRMQKRMSKRRRMDLDGGDYCGDRSYSDWWAGKSCDQVHHEKTMDTINRAKEVLGARSTPPV